MGLNIGDMGDPRSTVRKQDQIDKKKTPQTVERIELITGALLNNVRALETNLSAFIAVNGEGNKIGINGLSRFFNAIIEFKFFLDSTTGKQALEYITENSYKEKLTILFNTIHDLFNININKEMTTTYAVVPKNGPITGKDIFISTPPEEPIFNLQLSPTQRQIPGSVQDIDYWKAQKDESKRFNSSGTGLNKDDLYTIVDKQIREFTDYNISEILDCAKNIK